MKKINRVKINILENTFLMYSLVFLVFAMVLLYLYFLVNYLVFTYDISKVEDKLNKIVLENSKIETEIFKTKEVAFENLLSQGKYLKANDKIEYVKLDSKLVFNR